MIYTKVQEKETDCEFALHDRLHSFHWKRSLWANRISPFSIPLSGYLFVSLSQQRFYQVVWLISLNILLTSTYLISIYIFSTCINLIQFISSLLTVCQFISSLLTLYQFNSIYIFRLFLHVISCFSDFFLLSLLSMFFFSLALRRPAPCDLRSLRSVGWPGPQRMRSLIASSHFFSKRIA